MGRLLGQHATGPHVFWSVVLVSFVYLAIAFGLPFLIEHTKKSTAIIVVPISVACIVAVAVYGQHTISYRSVEDSFPLKQNQAEQLGTALDGIPKSERFPVTILCPDSAAMYANSMAAEFNAHGWQATSSCIFIIRSTSTGIAFAISADVNFGKVTIDPKGSMLMKLLDAAHVPYGRAVFDEVKGNAYWFIVALPPAKR